MPKVVIYTTQTCSFCLSAKRFFEQKRWPYEEIDLTDNVSLREKLNAEYHWRTVPMIFINDEFLGGFRDLIEKDSKGELPE